MLIKYLPALEEYESLVSQHISHAKTIEMSKKSEIVSMHIIAITDNSSGYRI